MIPYSRQHITEEDVALVTETLRSDYLTQGPAIPAFEKSFSDLHKVEHAVATSNATAALHIACLALGVTEGSRVWTVPTSFVASANCALYCGASVDFVDIDETTRLISIDALSAKLSEAAASGTTPDVVIPVDLSGLPCDYEAIRKLADAYGFRVLADCSHSVGASYQGGPVGSRFVDIAVFSFHPVKIVTTGEGGMAVTNDDELAQKLRLLRSHGITRDPQDMECSDQPGFYYEQQVLGYNYRMTDLQAALGSSQLVRLAEAAARRAALADRYDEKLAGRGWILPARPAQRTSAWHLYIVERSDSDEARRDALYDRLRDGGIGANVHYLPIHLQPYYRRLGFERGMFPRAERYADRALTIPLFPALTHDEQDYVIDQLGRGD